jgi:hypothetical protein
VTAEEQEDVDSQAAWEAKSDACLDLISEVEKEGLEHFQGREAARPLFEALYAFSERGLWNMDIEIKDIPEAIRVWAVIEHVRRHGFPDELRM